MAGDVTIRAYAPSEERAVAALWREVFPNNRPWHDPITDVRRKSEQNDELLLVGLVDEALIATIMIGFDGHRGWLYRVAVAPAWRGRGIGRAMVQAAEARLRARGCPKINLQIEGGNQAVAGFYERLGYTVEDRISMGKPL